MHKAIGLSIYMLITIRSCVEDDIRRLVMQMKITLKYPGRRYGDFTIADQSQNASFEILVKLLVNAYHSEQISLEFEI